MSTTFDEAVFDFDLNFFQHPPQNVVNASKTDKQRKAISIAKRKIIATDLLVKKYYAKQEVLEQSENMLLAAKEECKKVCIDYKNTLEKCTSLEKFIETLKNNYRGLESQYIISKNQYEAMQSHANQLQLLVKERELKIGSLTLEKKLLENNNATGSEKKVNSLKKRNEILLSHILIFKDIIFGKKKLQEHHKDILHKYKNVKKNESNNVHCDDTAKNSDDGNHSDDDTDAFENCSSPPSNEPLVQITQRCAEQQQLIDCGTSPNPDVEKTDIATSPIPFLNTDIGVNDHGTQISADNLSPKKNEIFSEKITVENIILETQSEIEICDKSNLEKKCLETYNSNNILDEGNNDREIEMILSTMRFNQRLLTPIPSTPPKSNIKSTRAKQSASPKHIYNHKNHSTCTESVKLREDNKVLQQSISDLAKEITSIKSLLEKYLLSTHHSNDNCITSRETYNTEQCDNNDINGNLTNKTDKSVVRNLNDILNKNNIQSKEFHQIIPSITLGDNGVNLLSENEEEEASERDLIQLSDLTDNNIDVNNSFLMFTNEDEEEFNSENVNNSQINNSNLQIAAESKSERHCRKLTKLQKLRHKLLPKYKIAECKTINHTSNKKSKRRPIPIANLRHKSKMGMSLLFNHKSAYEKAVKVMADVKTKEKLKEIANKNKMINKDTQKLTRKRSNIKFNSKINSKEPKESKNESITENVDEELDNVSTNRNRQDNNNTITVKENISDFKTKESDGIEVCTEQKDIESSSDKNQKNCGMSSDKDIKSQSNKQDNTDQIKLTPIALSGTDNNKRIIRKQSKCNKKQLLTLDSINYDKDMKPVENNNSRTTRSRSKISDCNDSKINSSPHKNKKCTVKNEENSKNTITYTQQSDDNELSKLDQFSPESHKHLKRPPDESLETLTKRILRSSKIQKVDNNNSACDQVSCSHIPLKDSNIDLTDKNVVNTVLVEEKDSIENTNIFHSEDNNERIITYNDLDLFSTSVEESVTESQLQQTNYPNNSILCKMIEKYGKKCSQYRPNKVPEQVANTICAKLEEDIGHIIELSADKSKQAMNKLVEDIQKYSYKNFLVGFMKYLKDPARKMEMHKKVNAPPAPPMTKSEQVMLYVVKQLEINNMDIVNTILANIEFALFQLNRTPDFDIVDSMSHFYALLCRCYRLKNRLRLFLLDAMYCLSFKVIPLVKQCLDVWMHTLPLAHMGIAKSPLVTCLVYLLHFYKCEDRFNRVQDIRYILKQKYFYQITDWNETKILEMFRNAVKEVREILIEKRILRMALIILAKRQGPKWCQKNIIKNMLLPIIERDGASDVSKRFCVAMLGPLLKPYPMAMKVHCEIIVNQLLDMLDLNPSDSMKEAIFTSLIYMNKHNQFRVTKALLVWQPAQVSSQFEELVRDFVREKPIKAWINFLPKLLIHNSYQE